MSARPSTAGIACSALIGAGLMVALNLVAIHFFNLAKLSGREPFSSLTQQELLRLYLITTDGAGHYGVMDATTGWRSLPMNSPMEAINFADCLAVDSYIRHHLPPSQRNTTPRAEMEAMTRAEAKERQVGWMLATNVVFTDDDWQLDR